MGISVIIFDIKWHRAVNELDAQGLEVMVKSIDEVVGGVQLQNPKVGDYAVFGTSFGTVLALYSAKRREDIKSIILNMPYGTIAHLLWTHKPSKPFKDRLVEKGIDSEEKLHELLEPIETQTDLDILRNRDIVNFTALNDKIVFDGQDFAEALKKANPNTKFHETQFGHFWGGIENILWKSKWDVVLK